MSAVWVMWLSVLLLSAPTVAWADADGDGFEPPEDCDDSDPAIRPDRPIDPCNDIDDDCDGEVDEDCVLGDPEDADRDGYAPPEDCDDTDPAIRPGAMEDCDGVDNDCNGYVDELCVVIDEDGDGVRVPMDCDDTDPTIHPLRPDLCNDIDDDCDGVVDEDCLPDLDGDGAAPPEDCDETDPLIGPHGVEVCDDGIDQNCDGRVDEGCAPMDFDEDGWYDFYGDCDDLDPSIHPGRIDGCDGVDEDCDGLVDEGCDGISLTAPDPGVAGGFNIWGMTGGTTGEPVVLAGGILGGATEVPWCPGVFLELDLVVPVNAAAPDEDGIAWFGTRLPGRLSGTTVWFQAVDITTCTVSAPVEWTLR